MFSLGVGVGSLPLSVQARSVFFGVGSGEDGGNTDGPSFSFILQI